VKLTSRLALQQLKNNRRRTLWTLFGIVLSVAMLVAVGGFGASGAEILNDAISHLYNEASGEAFGAIILSLAFILGSVTAVASIVVISNAFRVSAGERIKQFGILKSVGATKKQIAATVMYEGIFLSIIGMPTGLGMGLLLQFIATVTANSLIGSAQLKLTFAVYPGLVAVAAIGSFCVVLLSVWLPARKAAKTAAIDAIKGIGEVKLKKREKSKNPRIIGRVFGYEGVLAAKQLKRSRRHFRATVVSICISIMLILLADSLRAHMVLSFEGRGAQLGINFSQ